MKFLTIDAETVATLAEFAQFVEPHVDWLLDRFYMRLFASPDLTHLVPRGENYARVRARQRRHWTEHVFCGNFDQAYTDETRQMGAIHFKIGLDAAMLSATYEFVLEDIGILLTQQLPVGDSDNYRFARAVRKAVFLDLGLSNQRYYEAHADELEQMTQMLMLSLARAGEYRDDSTGSHVQRVGAMCRAVAIALGKPEPWSDNFEIASRLHDLGKIGIPNDILLKAGALDDSEITIMRTHPEIGADIIPSHPSEMITMARRTATTHHERWDGNGYPAGLKGDEIPLEGRIAAVCDVYDALQSERSYKRAWTANEAARFVAEHSGTKFDPRVVKCFMRILPAIDEIRAQSIDAESPAPQSLDATA